MKIDFIKFEIKGNVYKLSGCEAVNDGYSFVHTVKNLTNGQVKKMSLSKLKQILEKYDYEILNETIEKNIIK